MTTTTGKTDPGPHTDTIVAVATPPGEGAVGIVRLSGPGAIALAQRVFFPARDRDIARGPGRIFLGEIHDLDHVVDEVLLHVMRAPHSYTREDVVEVNCHGGAGPVAAVLDLFLRLGARLAEPGEFTRRAFVNGRLDLVQAEAVIDRIRAQTRAALDAAAQAASGALSREIHDLCDCLRDALARVEAAVDFPDEDLPELVDDALRASLGECRARMGELLATADAGRLVREGARVAIAGRPNVGKSSLFNALVRDARAIVTAVPGTTRDLLEEVITVRGIPVRLVDTAGLRESDDEVEQIGVARARQALDTAALVLFVVDGPEGFTTGDAHLATALGALACPVMLVASKADLAPAPALAGADAFVFAERASVSAVTGEGLADLEDAMARVLLGGGSLSGHHALVTRAHQRDSLRRAEEALGRALAQFGASPEFMSIDLRDALAALGEITGETTPEHLLDRIFASFCIGK
jgi:tRNA modification GTPase